MRERSREIGTRLAIGARAIDVMGQFLLEAVLLSVAGGLLGALCSVALIPPLEAYFGWDLSLSLRALAVATLVSSTLGVTFGSFSGTATVSATVETHLLAGLVYWNLHTSFRPGGEIRGQIVLVPAPATLGMLAIGLVGLAGVVRRRA